MRTLNEKELNLVSGGVSTSGCDECDVISVNISGVNTLVGGLLGSVGNLLNGVVGLVGGLLGGLLGSLNLGGLFGNQ